MNKLFFLTFLLLIGCKSNDKPRDLPLTRQQLQELLIDLHLFEANLNLSEFRSDSLKLDLSQKYDSIFNENNIQSEDFYTTYDEYLLEYPNELDSIYKSIIDLFEHKRDSIQEAEKLEEQTRIKADSTLTENADTVNFQLNEELKEQLD